MTDETMEFTVVIEAWFEADNPEDAEAIVRRLQERVFEHPSVFKVEAEQPEEQA